MENTWDEFRHQGMWARFRKYASEAGEYRLPANDDEKLVQEVNYGAVFFGSAAIVGLALMFAWVVISHLLS